MTHQRDEQPEDAGFERIEQALRAAFDETPEADRTALWQVVESGLGAQQAPWPVALRRSLGGFFHAPMRQLAIAGAAVAVVGAVLLSGVFQSGNHASAAVLEQVTGLSAATEAALADGVLTDQEIADLRERAVALLSKIEDDDQALTVLTPEELKLVVDTLGLVGGELGEHVDDDHGEYDDDFDEAVESILATTTRASDFRRERGDDDGDESEGDHGNTDEGDDGDGRAGILGTVEASETAEADETPEAKATSEATSAREGDGSEDETPEATGTAEKRSTPEADETPSANETSTTIAPKAGTYSFAAGSSGVVTFSFDGSEFEVVTVSEAGGWEAEIASPEGEEIKVIFQAGEQRMSFEVELHDGDIRIKTKLASSESSDDD